MNRYVYGHMLSFLLGKYLRVKWLGHIVGVGLTFKETANLFSKVVVPVYIPISSVGVSQLLHSLTNTQND